MINESNYQEYLDDFINGMLPEDLELAFVAFIDEHPYLLNQEQESPEEITLDQTFKMSLKRDLPVNESHLDELAIAEMEGDLSDSQRLLLEKELGQNAQFRQSRKLFALTRLEPDMEIVFPEKNRLKKRTVFFTVSRLASPIAAALLFGLLLMRFLLVNPAEEVISAVNPEEQSPSQVFNEEQTVRVGDSDFPETNRSSHLVQEFVSSSTEDNPVAPTFSDEVFRHERVPVYSISTLPVQNFIMAEFSVQEVECMDVPYNKPSRKGVVIPEQTLVQWAYKHVRSSLGAPAMVVPEEDIRADATNILLHKVSDVYHSNDGITRIKIGGIIITRSN